MTPGRRISMIVFMIVASYCFLSCTKDPGPNWSPAASPNPTDNSSPSVKGWEIIMGVPFGASEAETAKKIPALICKTDPHRNQRRECQDRKFEIGKAAVESNEFVFMNDKLTRVRFTYDVNDFDYIKNILTKKYGKPTEESDITLKDKEGAKLQRKIVRWESPKVRASLVKNDPSPSQGSAEFIDVTEENKRKSQMNDEQVVIVDD